LSELKQNLSVKVILNDINVITKNYLVEGGYFKAKDNHTLTSVVQVLFAGIAYLGIRIGGAITTWGYILIPVGIVGALILVSNKNKRTQLGVESTQEVLGFKEFLSVTDKDRFDFHNAPEKNPTQFMEYLPYAIAFGVEEKWAKQFEGMIIPQPSWYQSTTPGIFIASDFTNDMQRFGSSINSSITPASSGSGGGGSSGGGSGGGGGGSW
jgi:uncharacterized membrane protein